MKTNAAAKKKMNGRKKISLTALLIVLTVLVNLFSISCFIEQYEKSCRAARLQAQLEEEIKTGERLSVEYEKRTNYRDIEAYITENTNLKKAETYQYEYLRDESSNSSVVKNTEGDEGFLTQLSRTFSVIAEYFR